MSSRPSRAPQQVPSEPVGYIARPCLKKQTSSIEQVVPACKHISWAALFFLGVKPSVCLKTTNRNKHFSTFWLESWDGGDRPEV